MDDLCALAFGYGVGIVALLCVGLTLHFRGRRGKLSRALLAAATAGIVIALAIYFSYSYLVPMPNDPPAHSVDPNASLAAVFIQVTLKMMEGILYESNRVIDSFGCGVLAVVTAFSVSFLVPYRGGARVSSI